MAIPGFLEKLLAAAGPSGHEVAAATVWRDRCRSFGAEVGSDTVGSSFARVGGTAGGPRLAVVGHIDEIGLHVSHIDENGFLRFGQVGGWDALVLVGQRVRLLTPDGDIAGVIARKPVHLLKDDERKKAPEIKDLHIDIGAASAEEARSRVRIGDMAVIDAAPLELPGGRVVSRAIDNRVGCYVAAEVARLVAEAGGSPGDVLAFAVAQEETTLTGARTSAFAHDPDLAIVVDVTFATDQPGVELGEMTQHELGSGPVISRGASLHPRISKLLWEAAEREDIAYTLESHGRWTGTDADAIYTSRGGIPTALVSVPTRYVHSPVEMVALADLDATARVIAAMARALEPGMSFER